MAEDMSAALGAPQLAGALVEPRGWQKKNIKTNVGIGLGGVVGAAVGSSGTTTGPSDIDHGGRAVYIAVTAGEIVLFKTKPGALKSKPTSEVLTREARGELAQVNLKQAWLSILAVRFNDGREWEFEVPRAWKKEAASLVSVLNGSVD